MFLFLSWFCVTFSLFTNHALGKRSPLPRHFVLEDGSKPAIVGSYSYDPIRQVFVPPPSEQSHLATQDYQHYDAKDAMSDLTFLRTANKHNAIGDNMKKPDSLTPTVKVYLKGNATLAANGTTQVTKKT